MRHSSAFGRVRAARFGSGLVAEQADRAGDWGEGDRLRDRAGLHRLAADFCPASVMDDDAEHRRLLGLLRRLKLGLDRLDATGRSYGPARRRLGRTRLVSGR